MSRKAFFSSPPKRKPGKTRRPALSQHDLPAPYARLLTLGDQEADAVYDEIATQLKAADPRAAADRLLKMALDETYYHYWDEDEDDPRIWTRLHAVRVLQRLGEAAHSAIELLLPLLDEDDDALREEMPFFYAAMGAEAIEALARALMDSEANAMLRSGAGDALAEIAQILPEARAQIITILEQALTMETADSTLAAFIVCNLLDVGAKESLPLIRQAFEAERIDETVVEMVDVEEHFDLPRTTPRPDWQHNLDETLAAAEATRRTASQDGLPAAEPAPPPLASTPYVAPLKIERNAPCPCGSGKKYKKCCGA
jgi:hypothetical protein